MAQQDAVVEKLKALQKDQRTLVLAEQIFSNVQVRQFAYQTLTCNRIRHTHMCVCVCLSSIGQRGPCFHSRIYFAQRPLREEHLEVLELTKSREDHIQMQAKWANKSFAAVIWDIFSALSSDYVLGRVRLLDMPDSEAEGVQQQETAEQFVSLCVSVASQRAWTMMCLADLPPSSFLGVLDDDLAAASECLARAKLDRRLIKEAWQKANDSTFEQRQARTLFLNVLLMPC